MSTEEQQTINSLQANWIWIPNWVDSSPLNTTGRVVRFYRKFHLPSRPTSSVVLHFSADTRYKLVINGQRVAVGPARSSPLIWYYDTLDIAPYLHQGNNEVQFVVLRYFAATRGAMPFERTSFPGLTVVGCVETASETIDLGSGHPAWEAQVDESIQFPMGLVDDSFLHINERILPAVPSPPVKPTLYRIGTLNGDLPPWRLRPRVIPMPESSHASVNIIRALDSDASPDQWTAWLTHGQPLTLSGNSSHTLEVQADVHSTAFLRWTFHAPNNLSWVKLKVTYSEGYELSPRSYPFFRSKADRLDSTTGHLLGPYDEVTLDLLPSQTPTIYEPFWFRTFRLLRFELTTGPNPVDLLDFTATQTNYPMAIKASWDEPTNPSSSDIWAVSIRTMRNCMFDGYSDCPFYEQLQYAGDSRSVALFHYLLSGDDRLMRQAISNFAASVTPEGLPQSRFPSHVPQLIAGFSLVWILQVCDHHLYFGDKLYARSFLPRIDGVLEFFTNHVDSRGLVSRLPADVWQYVDWVTSWGATDEHPDKGVPTAGRKSNCHTYFSLLYVYALGQAAQLVRQVGRPGYAEEYEARAAVVRDAVRAHCYDGRYFTDSTVDVVDNIDNNNNDNSSDSENASAYSQHCQVFAVLAGAAAPGDCARLLREALVDRRFAKCSYMMKFYALRALSLAGEDVYETFWPTMWEPWRAMLANNLSTWEEDDVRQRSDCHAWGSVPVYEYCTELAGLRPIAPGWTKVLFRPRLGLSESVQARVALGKGNLASVSWETKGHGHKYVELRLEKAVRVISRLPGGEEVDHGVVDGLSFDYSEP
ncbi:hypothetical protein FE257_008019 [Aspergillus nanangensis]|uniref:Alpha-L-rhamnosidase six-hairpin glycosidase domain-containing protein n=1 Tax=Aspergillus nanangensis TaxID=2582783 RepID=A0AAD4CMG3_ASPNN|nr:hypothetical protein FE257_008019 [Aspergillus nanangensis]